MNLMSVWRTLMRILCCSKRPVPDTARAAASIEDTNDDDQRQEAERRRDELKSLMRKYDLEISLALGRRIHHDHEHPTN